MEVNVTSMSALGNFHESEHNTGNKVVDPTTGICSMFVARVSRLDPYFVLLLIVV